MDLGDQRAGGVNRNHVSIICCGYDRARYTMRRKYHRRAFGHLVQLFDKNGTLCRESIDNGFIMDNFVPDIDRLAKFLQRDLDNSYRAINACTKSARGRQCQLFYHFFHSVCCCLFRVLRSIAVQ